MNATFIHQDGSTESCKAYLNADGTYTCVMGTIAFALVCTIHNLLMF